MTDTVRIGLVGTGAIAQLAHLPVLSKMRGVQVAVICDNDRAKAQALAERFDIYDVVTDIEDLLEIKELGAVIVATPNHLHEPHVLSALAAGKHVLCERPLALSSRGIERLIDAASHTSCRLMVANNHRFRADVQALDRFLRAGELGQVNGVRTGAYHFKRPDAGWRRRRAESGGGAFFDHGLPLLDLALWLADFPEPRRVTAHMNRSGLPGAVEDAMLVHLECQNNVVFSFDVSGAYVGEEERWWFEVLADRGSARLAPLRVVKELNGRPFDVSPAGAASRESAFIQSYRAELAHFLAVVRGTAAYEPPTDQVTLHRVVEAIYRSADEGHEIRL
ncbi:MAG: Gfo/Idh/MocA family oxidoreductase [Gemmatimonadaceae bacterium]|nr:Gfo/Idh/MocA family oxidoreductase [Gemmatimonadaceae bacterium]